MLDSDEWIVRQAYQPASVDNSIYKKHTYVRKYWGGEINSRTHQVAESSLSVPALYYTSDRTPLLSVPQYHLALWEIYKWWRRQTRRCNNRRGRCKTGDKLSRWGWKGPRYRYTGREVFDLEKQTKIRTAKEEPVFLEKWESEKLVTIIIEHGLNLGQKTLPQYSKLND